jgi:hypothetical protein
LIVCWRISMVHAWDFDNLTRWSDSI